MTDLKIRAETAADTAVPQAQTGVPELIVAAVLMGVTAYLLIGTGMWALTFNGRISKELSHTLDGHSLTALGVLLVVVGSLLFVCMIGVWIGPRVNRWVGLTSRLVAILLEVVIATTGLWLVAFYSAWAVTCTVMGAIVVYALTMYERKLHSEWPWAPLRAQFAQVLALNTKGLNVPRGVGAAGLLLIADVVLASLNQQRYFLSVAFGLLFVMLSDPGGEYTMRLRRMAAIGVTGALITALGFGIGNDPWGYVVLVVFAITAASGILVNIDLQALVAGIFLNVWLLITLSVAVAIPAKFSAHPSNQALAWLIGAAMALALMTLSWLLRGRTPQPSPLPEIPADLPPIKLSPQIIGFVLIRAIAVSIPVAFAFGLNVTNADWMPLATLVAMKPNLQQSSLKGVQRLVGTALGSGVAACLLVTVGSGHALEELIILLMGVGMSIVTVNYALYTAAIAAAALIALDLPNPTDLSAEGRRVFFTFVGVAIAIIVMVLADLLQKDRPPAQTSPADTQQAQNA